MKKKIQKTLAIFILAAFFLCLIVNVILQMYTARQDMVSSSLDLFRQVEQIVDNSDRELSSVVADFSDTCLLRAKAAAYILEHHPERITDVKELNKIADLMDIDEIHIFNPNGTIYSGNIPEYYNLSLYDGEQIRFFLPMLQDTTLSLCQAMTPNTAEGKMMQYAAVWMENESGIVQIGMEPTRIVELTKQNELSYIFSLLTDGEGSTLLAVDPETHEILGSTLSHTVGLNTDTIGIPAEDMCNWEKGFYVTLGGIRTYAVFRQTDSLILGRILSLDNLYKNMHLSNLRLTVYLLLIFMAQWILISTYLERSFVRAIDKINAKLQHISDGNLGERLSVHTTPEFTELSTHINHMVKKLESELWQDELTGIYSRRGFYTELKELFQAGSNLENTAIIMIDSDDLKKTNDRHGHENGDKYLCAIAGLLCQLNAPYKMVARLSGDEFAILLPRVQNRETLTGYLNQLLDLRDSHYIQLTNGEPVLIRFSVGMGVYGEDGTTYTQLLKAADIRMYEDKMNRKKASTV